jgi:hypothetical protein
MRGHMHWLLTAVTDSIAWATLPTATFLRYFRNDILIAGLMRNFLLAVCAGLSGVLGHHFHRHHTHTHTHTHTTYVYSATHHA